MQKRPKIVVFAGPNGSGKSTITGNSTICGEYINADNIQKAKKISVMDAALEAEALREKALLNRKDFTFETVLSTERNLNLLQRAKEAGYFVRGYYVLTCSVDINIMRVKARVAIGGHDVPEDKIRERYKRALKILPKFINICDVCSVYDNSLDIPFKIYKKYHGNHIQPNNIWTYTDIINLLDIEQQTDYIK